MAHPWSDVIQVLLYGLFLTVSFPLFSWILLGNRINTETSTSTKETWTDTRKIPENTWKHEQHTYMHTPPVFFRILSLASPRAVPLDVPSAPGLGAHIPLGSLRDHGQSLFQNDSSGPDIFSECFNNVIIVSVHRPPWETQRQQTHEKWLLATAAETLCLALLRSLF